MIVRTYRCDQPLQKSRHPEFASGWHPSAPGTEAHSLICHCRTNLGHEEYESPFISHHLPFLLCISIKITIKVTILLVDLNHTSFSLIMTKRQGIQEKVNISKSQNQAKDIAVGSRGGKGEILLVRTLVMRNRGRFKKKPHKQMLKPRI